MMRMPAARPRRSLRTVSLSLPLPDRVWLGLDAGVLEGGVPLALLHRAQHCLADSVMIHIRSVRREEESFGSDASADSPRLESEDEEEPLGGVGGRILKTA